MIIQSQKKNLLNEPAFQNVQSQVLEPQLATPTDPQALSISEQESDDEPILIEQKPATVSQIRTNPPSLSEDTLKEQWPAFLEFLMKDRPNLGSFLSFASIGAVSSKAIELNFSTTYRFQYLEVTKKNNKGEITALLAEFIGFKVELNIVIDTSTSEKEEVNYIKQIGNIPTTINDQIEKEPIIQTILEIFDGEILD